MNIEDFKEIKPIGDFIINQKDIEPVITTQGAYYHYKDVCTLLKRVLKSEEWVNHFQKER